ncbi:MAG: IS66 family insertion sequence element accessory protein TnpA [Terriglobia bacterium]
MSRQVNSVLWNEWRQRLKRQRESGLSICEFCRRENLSPHTFHSWRRKLPAATREPSAMRPARQGRTAMAAPPRPGGFLQLPVVRAPQSPWIELSLADGTVVRVPQQNTAAVLAVLRELRGESRDATAAEHGDA